MAHFKIAYPVARKPHLCDGCGTEISAGTQYVQFSGALDGSLVTWRYHKECKIAEDLCNSHFWPEEALFLSDHVKQVPPQHQQEFLREIGREVAKRIAHLIEEG